MTRLQMKKIMIVLLGMLVSFSLSACSKEAGREDQQTDIRIMPPEESVLMEITITAGEVLLDGVLFDNDTARAFADMLPLTADLWHPAYGFARAFNLPETISVESKQTQNYELGGLAYWHDGPSVAIFYGNDFNQTIVPIVNIGRISSDINIFREYGEEITINKKEEKSK